MVNRRQAMKTFALGAALLNPELLERIARADPTSAAGAAGVPTPATGGAGPATAGVTVRQMMMQPLPIPGNRVVAVVVVEYAPGAGSPPHLHPGPVFGYVLEGRVEIGIDQAAPITYSAGDTWYEAPCRTHRVSRNASATDPAKILAFLIVKKGEPILEPARSATDSSSPSQGRVAS